MAPGHVHSIQRKAKSRWIDAFFCFFWGLFDSTDGRRPLPISKKCFQHKSGLQLRTYIQLYQAIIAIDQSIALSIKTEEGLGLGFGPWLGPMRPRVRWSPWLGAEARPNQPNQPHPPTHHSNPTTQQTNNLNRTGRIDLSIPSNTRRLGPPRLRIVDGPVGRLLRAPHGHPWWPLLRRFGPASIGDEC